MVRNGLFQGLLVAIGGLSIAALSTAACGSDIGDSEFDERGTNPSTTSSSGGATSGSLGPNESCTTLECRQVQCADPNVTTTLSGIVTAPNGTLPLYNAIVYVPTEPLDAVPEGASCDRCGNVSGKPIVAAVSGPDGRFVLKNVPAGKDLPLVVQVGKWRRELVVDTVSECVDNPVSPEKTRLPRSSSEGHIPKIAVTTGRCDQLACLLPKLGLDASEYTASTGPGRLHLFRGASTGTAPNIVQAPAPSGSLNATELWSDVDSLKQYDMVMLSCECGEHNETKPSSSKDAMYAYASAGGRIFASHYHYAWTQVGPLKGTAQWLGGSDDGNSSKPPFFVDTSFPKGAAFADWLVNVKATSTHGQIPLSQPRRDVGVVYSGAQRWVYEKGWIFPGVPNPLQAEATKYLSVNTPVGKPVEEQCGKFVYADMHLYGGDVQPAVGALPDDAFPDSCSKDLTPEEKALAFLFFDLSSCVQDDTKAPPLPVK